MTKWKNARDILCVVRTLKKDSDPALPTRRNEIVRRYNETKHRSRRFVDEDMVRKYQLSLMNVKRCSSSSVEEGRGTVLDTTPVQM